MQAKAEQVAGWAVELSQIEDRIAEVNAELREQAAAGASW